MTSRLSGPRVCKSRGRLSRQVPRLCQTRIPQRCQSLSRFFYLMTNACASSVLYRSLLGELYFSSPERVAKWANSKDSTTPTQYHAQSGPDEYIYSLSDWEFAELISVSSLVASNTWADEKVVAPGTWTRSEIFKHTINYCLTPTISDPEEFRVYQILPSRLQTSPCPGWYLMQALYAAEYDNDFSDWVRWFCYGATFWSEKRSNLWNKGSMQIDPVHADQASNIARTWIYTDRVPHAWWGWNAGLLMFLC